MPALGRHRLHQPLALILLGLAVACSSGGQEATPGQAASTTERGPAGDRAGPAEGAASPGTTLARATVPSCPPTPARRAPDPARPRYQLEIDVQPASGVVTGTTDVRFTPDVETDRLVFRLWPNGPRQAGEGASMETGQAEIDGKPAPSALEDPTTLVIPLAAPLAAGQQVRARLPWRLQLPFQARDRISAEEDAVRLGSFLPLLEWEPGVGWVQEPPTTRFAEASTAPTADFDLTVTTPPGYQVIASGTSERPGHWSATAMRDVAVAVGRFTTVTGTARAPDPVRVTVGVDAEVGESPEPYLERAVAALEDFSRRFGPYPWKDFAVSVTGTISTGIEYPGHVLHGRGTSGDVLSHEVAHQWFYALVGNNQGRDPWLDEAPTTWAEARFEGTVDDYRARPIPADIQGRTTAPMSYWDRRDDFYVGAYVQGAQALAALGDAELVDCALRAYAAQHAHRIARAHDLVASLAAVFPDAESVLAGYGIHP